MPHLSLSHSWDARELHLMLLCMRCVETRRQNAAKPRQTSRQRCVEFHNGLQKGRTIEITTSIKRESKILAELQENRYNRHSRTPSKKREGQFQRCNGINTPRTNSLSAHHYHTGEIMEWSSSHSQSASSNSSAPQWSTSSLVPLPPHNQSINYTKSNTPNSKMQSIQSLSILIIINLLVTSTPSIDQ